MTDLRVLDVAVFAPVRSNFDYLCPRDIAPSVRRGMRVLVPFGRSQRIGVVLGVRASSALPANRLKPILRLLDPEPLLDQSFLALARWVANYYHYPLGAVFETLLPPTMRRSDTAARSAPREFVITPAGCEQLASGAALGLRQRQLLGVCASGPLSDARRRELEFDALRVARELIARGWLLERPAVLERPRRDTGNFLALNEDQQRAYQMIARAPPGYRAHLLHGITGSGKTEIYLHLIRDTLDAADQALVLVPEIGLTDQLVTRFRECFGSMVAVVHSGLGEATRSAAWHACREKRVKILLGTRSAVWLPLPALRLVIVDEEHDLSYKQQDGLRYSARDVAVMRARRAGIPVILGSATPSLESFANCERDKYRYIKLTERAGGAEPPVIKLIDVRGRPLSAGMSDPLRLEMNAVLERGEQALVFLNRRGYAPIVLCHQCGWIASCERCDARLVLHKRAAQLRCHHCGAARSIRAEFAAHACGRLSDYVELGTGTEQVESALTNWFPNHRIVRIDRDSMTRKGQLERALAQVRAGRVDILVGTQMISKGHHFAGVTLVGIIDADSRLLANDFRAEERFMQLVIQVAGRAGRGKQAGTVLLQTHYPHHPIFPFIVSGRYRDFVQHALRERKAAELPPFRPLALLRAEATVRAAPSQFLNEVADALRRQMIDGVAIDGPIIALMEKRIGKFRANLMLLADDRSRLARALSRLLEIIEKSATARKVRWTLDVDAQDVS